MTTFVELRKINVNDKVEKKNGLSYLSWSWAWDQFKQAYPDATYEILKTETGLPYFESSAGAMCYTKVTAGGITHEMWLPVMDNSNASMKSEPYEYQTRNGKKTCQAYTMFDINKTLMRCLVKNLAMFGLALYIYSGEDLPEEDPVDLSPWLDQITKAPNLDSLKQIYKAAVDACGEKLPLRDAATARKNQLS